MPGVLMPESVSARNGQSIIGTKSIKSGQKCRSVDYCLVPRSEMEAFIQLAIEFKQGGLPSVLCERRLYRHHHGGAFRPFAVAQGGGALARLPHRRA